MLQHRYVCFLAGLSIGYVLSSSFLLVLVFLAGTICYFWKKAPKRFLAVLVPVINYAWTYIFKLSNYALKSDSSPKKLNILIRTDIRKEIEDYCKWKQESPDLFVAKSASLILVKDKDWVAYQRALKKISRN